ncbi:MAG: pilus assembly protein CpaD [Rhodospirillaceae bacterium]|jgi:pilus biogenesis lipoprotein CpaD|nr:pilus assembly protein CpaD [Rhodospirillaceae bacterium]
MTKYRQLALPLVLLLAGATAACTPTPRVVTYATWKQQPAFSGPQVKVVPVALDLPFGIGSNDLSQENEAALDSFLGRNGLKNGATVDLSVAAARPDQDPLIRSRISTVKRSLARRGIMVETVMASPSDRADTVHVLGKATTITMPACPGYNAPIQYDSEWQPIFDAPGCSNTINLELMVANPADLAQGRALPPADGEGMTMGVSKYHAGQVPALSGTGVSTQ